MLINQKDLENIAQFWGSTYEDYHYKILVVGETIDSAKDYAERLASEHSDEFRTIFNNCIQGENFHVDFTSKDEPRVTRGQQHHFVIIENLEKMLVDRFLNQECGDLFNSIMRAFGREFSSTNRKAGSHYSACFSTDVPEASLSYNQRILDFNGKLSTLGSITRKWNKQWNVTWKKIAKKNENKLNVLLIGDTHEDIYEMALKITKTYGETLMAGLTVPFESESFSFDYIFWENEESIVRNSGVEFVVAKDLLNKAFDKDKTRTHLAYNKLTSAQNAIDYTQNIVNNKSRLYIESNRIIDWKNIGFYL